MSDTDTALCIARRAVRMGPWGFCPQTSQSNVYQTRWISADGSRVFFDSNEALVPQDTNGLLDVV